METRRTFLKTAALSTAILSIDSPVSLWAAAEPEIPETRFLFGADVYPDIQSAQATESMLDNLQRAHMNTVRVGESNWGNLETAPGRFNFGWLQEFLDNLEQRRMRAILGTSTFIPPQWLAGAHPEMLVVLQPGAGPSDPMSRHSPCLNHPLYREACRRFIGALGKQFHDHPAVLGWQLDNEIDFLVSTICYNPACEAAWQRWLRRTYHTPQEFNDKLALVDWGMKIDSFDEVPQPRAGVEGGRNDLPALSLASLHFERDTILNFLAEQAAILRQSGVRHEILTDWNPLWLAFADDPKAQSFMSIAGLNYYQRTSGKERSTEDDVLWHLDLNRSCYGKRRFIVTETRFGVTGSTRIDDPAPSQEQFRMWNLQLAAFGASGLLYWTGNRWRGGHWPQWGGLFDWTGHPEPDFSWAIEMGDFFAKSGPALIENPVAATAVVLTDFDQRVALEVYPHIPHSRSVITDTFTALHRLGIGTDTINSASMEVVANLRQYPLAVLPATTAFDNPRAVAALHQYAEEGGTILITPFTACMDNNGVFRGDGFGANMTTLTGTLVRTIRWVGSPDNGDKAQLSVEWKGPLLNQVSTAGLDGYVEYLEIGSDTEVVASFQSDQPIVNRRPAATRRPLGKGTVVKLGFWPGDESLLALLQKLLPPGSSGLGTPLPNGVQAVPRSDGSFFLVNSTGEAHPIELRKEYKDRISGRRIATKYTVERYEVLWLD